MRWHRQIAMVAVAAGVCVGMTQPPQDSPQPRPRPEQPAGDRQPEDRESYKARLERSLADNKRRQERLEAALRKLAEGVSVEEVRRETESPRPPEGMREPRSVRGPGRPGERGPEGPPLERLTREEVISILETHTPQIGERFRKAMTDNPATAGRIIDRMEPMVRELKAERDPEMRQLRIDNLNNGFELVGATRAYSEAFRADAASPATQEAREKLRGLLGAHFDVRTRMHQQEIILLERRVTQLREDLSQQLADREKFIERRLEDVKRFRSRGEKSGEGKNGEPKPDRGVGEPKR